jgi:hypothetical protein
MADCGNCNGPSCNLYINSLADHHITSNNAYWQGEYAVRVREGHNIAHRDIKTFEPTAIVAAPGFVSNIDLHLQQTSSMINQGTSTDAPKLDIDGEDRLTSGKMDIGADEWQEKLTTPEKPKPPQNLRILTND